jgi:hypothetical protein
MRFPKPRYRLATLLILMTAIAIALWAVPEWREYRRRMNFERVATQLKSGADRTPYAKLPPNLPDGNYRIMQSSDAAGNYVNIISFRFQHYWYTLYFVQERVDPAEQAAGGRRGRGRRGGSDYKERWSEFRVYRMRPAPRNYVAQTDSAKTRVERAIDEGRAPPDSAGQYMDDFHQVITGRAKSDLGIQYDLIHMDRPQMPE